MRKAVLYARVSTHLQEKERTIDSQVLELKKQIEKNGDILVKEYIDDGYSGAYLDRPALEEMRAASKTDLYEVVYFLAADRIARKSLYQDIIIDELLRHKKRVIIGDKDYEKNPENDFALKVFGAVSEFERAKIMERTRRGRLHHLRNGVISAHGNTTFGYTFVRRTLTTPQKLVINEKEAEAIRYIFEQFASGAMGLNAISRSLEKKGVLTRKGKTHWNVAHLTDMMSNTTYMGVRYFNRLVREDQKPDEPPKKWRKFIYRDPSEWITVKVPAIVSKRLFDKAQKRLEENRKKYRQPRQRQLLRGLVKCGECGKSYCSARGYMKDTRSRKMRVRYWTSYTCTTRWGRPMHDPSKWRRCYNPRIGAHILDERVLRLIASTMFNADKLSLYTKKEEEMPNVNAARELVRIAERVKKLDEVRNTLMRGYAMGRTPRKKYVARNRDIDNELKRLDKEKIEVMNVSGLKNSSQEKRIKEFCLHARLQFESCRSDTESLRNFLLNHIEKIIFMRGRIAVLGSIKAPEGTELSALPFRLEGEIDHKQSRIYARLPPEGLRDERGIYRNRIVSPQLTSGATEPM